MSRPSIQELREWVDKNASETPCDELGGYSPRGELRSALDSLYGLLGTARAFHDEGDRIEKRVPSLMMSKPRHLPSEPQEAGEGK